MLIRAAAFLLQLLVRLRANMNVKKKEEEEYVQENHLNLQKKNAKIQDLLVKNQEIIQKDRDQNKKEIKVIHQDQDQREVEDHQDHLI